MSDSKGLLLINFCSADFAKNEEFVSKLNGVACDDFHSVVYVIGKKRSEILAKQAGERVSVFRYDRLFLGHANELIAQSGAKRVALNNQMDIDLDAVVAMTREADEKDDDAVIARPSVFTQDASGETKNRPNLKRWLDKDFPSRSREKPKEEPAPPNQVSDLAHWLYNVPQTDMVSFLFLRSFVVAVGGFNQIYPLVAHWDMAIRLASSGGSVALLEKAYLPEPASYVPGNSVPERTQFLLQGMLMLQDHGEVDMGMVNHLLLQYNLYEQINTEKKPLYNWSNPGVREHLVSAIRYSISSCHYHGPWLELNGITKYQEIYSGMSRDMMTPSIFPRWLRPIINFVRRFFLWRLRRRLSKSRYEQK